MRFVARLVGFLVVGVLALPVVAALPSIESPTVAAGGEWSMRFTEAGEYPYICTFHANMKGHVTVKEGASSENVTVRMIDNDYAPKTVEVGPGATVSWVNEGKQAHNIRSAKVSTPFPAVALLGLVVGLAAVAFARRG